MNSALPVVPVCLHQIPHRKCMEELETLSLYALVEKFHTMLSEIRKHIFNIRDHLHIDFAENYLCQYSREIQSVHFGGSHKQTTLPHTGVLYEGQHEPQPLCTVSDSRMHDSVAIWCLF